MADSYVAAAVVLAVSQSRCNVPTVLRVTLQSASVEQPIDWHEPLTQTVPLKLPSPRPVVSPATLQSESLVQGKVHVPLVHFERTLPVFAAHCESEAQAPVGTQSFVAAVSHLKPVSQSKSDAHVR